MLFALQAASVVQVSVKAFAVALRAVVDIGHVPATKTGDTTTNGADVTPKDRVCTP